MEDSENCCTTEEPESVSEEGAKRYGVAKGAFLSGQEAVDSVGTLSGSLLARSTFMKRAGALLFGTAAAVMLPNAPEADAVNSAPCVGYNLCGGGCCGDRQCIRKCSGFYGYCRTGGQCWFTCTQANKKIKCCDCSLNGINFCICRYNVGMCS